MGFIDFLKNMFESPKIETTYVTAKDKQPSGRLKHFQSALAYAKQFGQDYLISSNGGCCPKCAPYRGRMFNISGKDKRFPKLSDYIHNPEDLCCLYFCGSFYYKGLTISEYVYDSKGTVKTKEMEAIKFSNRPFVDDRCEYIKSRFEERQIKRKK